MAFIQLSGVSLSFGARDIISNATLNLQNGSRAALAGPNGTGKSTLMKIAAGIIKPDAGEVIVTKGARVVYLPQTGIRYPEGTVYEIAEEAFSRFKRLLEEQEEIGCALEAMGDLDENQMERLIEAHHQITETVEASGYWRREERIAEVLRGLDFKPQDFNRPAADLSGGWQMRLALARVLLEDPDVMLLDEPTNYLDLEARTWLEGFLQDYRGAVLLVSHDRYFLDVTVREVYELFNGTLTRYVGTYTQYETRRAQELDALFEAWERQQEEIQRIEDFIRRFRYKESKAPQVQSRIKMLEKMTRIEIPEGMKRIHFSFPPAPRSGQAVVRLRDISKSYGERLVIDRFSLDIERGTKLALVGPNGAGKSTLMRIIAGADVVYEGSVVYGANVSIGYFSQESAERMESDSTVFDVAEASCPPHLLPKLNNLLGAFLFRGDDLEKPVSVLSGGERSRLALLILLMHPSNLLVLDEPTNHLDLTSKDILLEALRAFEGTVIFVSHDRQFLDELADRVLELSCGRAPKLHYGNYAYYLEKKVQEEGQGGSTVEERKGAGGGVQSVVLEDPTGSGSPQAARSWEEEKAKRARLRKLKKRQEDISARLEEIAGEKRRLESELARPDVYVDGARTRRILEQIAGLEEEVEQLNNEWLELEDSALNLV